jgi:site-specific DNA recombinase
MLVCGHCRRRLAISKRTDGTRRYTCHPVPGTDSCGRIAVQAHHVEAEVRDQVLAVLTGPHLEAILAAESDGGTRADALAQLEAAEDRLADLARAYAAGDIQRREWLAAREVAEQRIAATRHTLDTDGRGQILADRPSDPDARARWDAEGVEWRRGILSAVIDQVLVKPAAVRGRRVFDPHRIEIVWRA